MTKPLQPTRWALALAAAFAVQFTLPAAAQNAPQSQSQDPAQARAAQLVAKMTLDEKISLVFGYFGTEFQGKQPPKEALVQSAGYVKGIERLGITAQWLTDAGIGVASQPGKKVRERTSLPAGIATAATWNPELAFKGAAMIGKEARLSGFNVMLGGSVNLAREPRNGRNFEYTGEDPLLAGVMAGAQIAGVQSNHVVSTLKHFAYNDQETGRNHVNVKIADPAGRMSDLLAFQVAIERGNPGSVMCSYNRVNGPYACEHDHLLNKVLKGDWGFKGYVMSDWGATHSTIPAALNGLDQQSGYPFDKSPYFDGALKEAVQNGHVPESRLDDMVRRILWALGAHGALDHPVKDQSSSIDYAAHGKISQLDAEEGIVLLKNEGGVLPLAAGIKRIAIIGGHANKGVLSGGGSAQVYPRGGLAVPNEGPKQWPGPMAYLPGSPMQALAKRTKAVLSWNDGKDLGAAAKAAAAADVVLVFANQWTSEGNDVPNLSLPNKQDALIEAVAKANRKTVVVLQTGGPVTMPWLPNVAGVVEAWYPGSNGGEAIARVLSGEVDASGRLPQTFPASEAQLPRPKLDGVELPKESRFDVDYNIEGAAVGYKWFDLKGHKPLFAFGHGLSYTSFAHADLKAEPAEGSIRVSFSTANTGQRDGKAVPQVYVAKAGWEAPKRLGGWDKVALKAGERRISTVLVDPRTLAVFDGASGKWKIAAGDYQVILATAADAPVATVTVRLPAREFAAGGR
ncbi:glycoside hydrolase family 3 protein [Massilia sp. ST3]|uniref:beta-glucosidase n=1 Tax=Massilia sp. ST3 TaxID=2824903 RepID=UPI001B82F944|nr:glycoside hydrolase family 3 protein [Massilia sp. ST3]MBQ5945960.1 glycoside hydrolase family 3 protein [Massilia sp. ST3]